MSAELTHRRIDGASRESGAQHQSPATTGSRGLSCPPDDDFWRRYIAGDPKVFASLISRYGRVVASEVRRWTRNGADAAELSQEVWLLVWTKRASFRGATSIDAAGYRGPAFSAWVGRLSRTLCSHRFRRKRDEVSLNDPDGCGFIAGPPQSSEADLSDTGDDVWDAVLGLPERQRLVVLYRLCFGYSTARTASVLRCRPGTVQAALFGAKHSLRRRLQRDSTD